VNFFLAEQSNRSIDFFGEMPLKCKVVAGLMLPILIQTLLKLKVPQKEK